MSFSGYVVARAAGSSRFRWSPRYRGPADHAWWPFDGDVSASGYRLLDDRIQQLAWEHPLAAIYDATELRTVLAGLEPGYAEGFVLTAIDEAWTPPTPTWIQDVRRGSEALGFDVITYDGQYSFLGDQLSAKAPGFPDIAERVNVYGLLPSRQDADRFWDDYREAESHSAGALETPSIAVRC